MIKIAICDDEKCFINAIEKMLKTYAEKNGQDFLIKKYTKPLQLMEALKEEFQIFFLDIEMPSMDGLELVDVIRKHDEKSIVLFVSSHNELVGVGYKYDVQNFITKPVTQVQINCEMNRAIRKLNTYEQRYIAVKNEKGYFKLFLSDIEYIETVNRKVLFHLRNGEQEDGYFKMRDLEERLEPFFFVRCHNGIIVNVDCIESLHDLTIKLYSGEEIYITRSRKQNLIKKWQNGEDVYRVYGQIILKDIFSLLNILLLVYLLTDSKLKIDVGKVSVYSYILCIGGLYFIRVMENGTELHIVYNYGTIVMIAMIIGHFLFQYNLRFSLLIGSIFLSIVLLGQLLSCTFLYPYSGGTILAELSSKYQNSMTIISEIIIIIGSLVFKKVIRQIPAFLEGINMIVIIIPLFINIVVMAICADQLYYDKGIIIGNIWSVMTVMAVCIVMFIGTFCNIIILGNYLNVKKIENEKKLQISEISMQYDYYVKQSNDMENIRRLSHDIKNHLEALRGDVDYHQKMDYIDGIERKLSIYQSYYKTGNTFIDNVLHVKRLEALDKKIEFKVFADFSVFRRIKNEDLCVIVSNTVDNALRECQLMKEEDPEVECLIQLKARKLKGFLSIICENTLRECQAEFIKNNRALETSKEDKKNHGFGVKNIKSVVKDYGGEVSFHVVDGMFSVSVIIPIEV